MKTVTLLHPLKSRGVSSFLTVKTDDQRWRSKLDSAAKWAACRWPFRCISLSGNAQGNVPPPRHSFVCLCLLMCGLHVVRFELNACAEKHFKVYFHCASECSPPHIYAVSGAHFLVYICRVAQRDGTLNSRPRYVYTVNLLAMVAPLMPRIRSQCSAPLQLGGYGMAATPPK